MKNTDLTYEIQSLTRVERNRPKCGKVPEIGAKAVISPMEHNELLEVLGWTRPKIMVNVRTNTPQCQPSRMPTMRPEVPHHVAQTLTQGIDLFQQFPQSVRDKIMGTNNSRQCDLTAILWNRSVMNYERISKKDKHLNMALLQTTLDTVKVGQVKVVAVISRFYLSG